MQRFLSIIREDLTSLENMTDQERYSRSVEELLAWVKSLTDAGLHLQGEPLAIKGRLVRKDQIIADGPFVDAKEGIAGFDIIHTRKILLAGWQQGRRPRIFHKSHRSNPFRHRKGFYTTIIKSNAFIKHNTNEICIRTGNP